MVKVPQYTAIELDTREIVSGYYYLENGYWTINGVDDISRPVIRHKIVDEDGCHRDIAEETLEQL